MTVDTAIIEVAQTVGLQLIEPEQRNPMRTTSWGVGEQVLHAYRHGARRFIIGLGGSATSDSGTGMLRALDTPSVAPTEPPMCSHPRRAPPPPWFSSSTTAPAASPRQATEPSTATVATPREQEQQEA